MSTKKETKGKIPVTDKAKDGNKDGVAAAAVADTIDWEKLLEEQEKEAPTGFENVEQSDLGIPFLQIIQAKSAEVDKAHKDHATKKIEDAEAGDIYNTVSREVYGNFEGDAVVVIPCGYEKTYIEWKPRNTGGGLVKVHRNPAILEEVTGRDEKNKDILRNGNVLETTHSYYVMVIRNGEKPAQAVINMSSSQLRCSRRWLNMMSGIKLGPKRLTPPMYSHYYHLTTVIEKKDNDSWFGWNVEIGDMVTSPALVAEGKSICAFVVEATRKALAAPASVKQIEDKDDVI